MGLKVWTIQGGQEQGRFCPILESLVGELVVQSGMSHPGDRRAEREDGRRERRNDIPPLVQSKRRCYHTPLFTMAR